MNVSTPICLYTIFFGGESGKEALQEMKNIAAKHLPNNSSQSGLCCQFTHNIDEKQLVNHLTTAQVNVICTSVPDSHIFEIDTRVDSKQHTSFRIYRFRNSNYTVTLFIVDFLYSGD